MRQTHGYTTHILKLLFSLWFYNFLNHTKNVRHHNFDENRFLLRSVHSVCHVTLNYLSVLLFSSLSPATMPQSSAFPASSASDKVSTSLWYLRGIEEVPSSNSLACRWPRAHSLPESEQTLHGCVHFPQDNTAFL